MTVGQYSANVHFNGPDELVIDDGGKLTVKAGGTVTGVTATVPAASPTVAGAVKQAASQPAAAGANPTKAEYDALLTALRTAGIMA